VERKEDIKTNSIFHFHVTGRMLIPSPASHSLWDREAMMMFKGKTVEARTRMRL
jgi:hypothetical protein